MREKPLFEFELDVDLFGNVIYEIYEWNRDKYLIVIFYPWEREVGGDERLYDIILADTVEKLLEMSRDDKYADYKDIINFAINIRKEHSDELEYRDKIYNYFEDKAIEKLIERLGEEANDTGWDDSTKEKINYILDNLKRNNFIFERNYEGWSFTLKIV